MKTYPHIHIIGGGLAGMAAALGLRSMRYKGEITIYEASHHLGGRCTSLFIPSFNKEVDNGTHMIIKANKNAEMYLKSIGSIYNFFEASPKIFWERKSLSGLFGLAIRSTFNTRKNVPLKLIISTLGKALKAPYPLFPYSDLRKGFILPFLNYAEKNNIRLEHNARCTGFKDGKISFLGKDTITLGAEDKVIFAMPAWALAGIFTDMGILKKLKYNPITNIHFLLPLPYAEFLFTGVVEGLGDWFRLKDNVLSVTVSDFGGKIDKDTVFAQAKKFFPLPEKYEQAEIISEKLATISQDKDNLLLRNDILDKLANNFPQVLFAGDWTCPSLPCTIEASITSGFRCAGRIAAKD